LLGSIGDCIGSTFTFDFVFAHFFIVLFIGELEDAFFVVEGEASAAEP
jgi:hypothetical protein